jgi:type III secretion system YscQ/HrcQ family protein
MMTSAFDITSLPHVACADFATARRMARRFGDTPRHLNLTVAPFGRLSLTFTYLGPSVPPAQTMTVWNLRRGHESGWLSVENIGGLRIVAALLGIASPRINRPLRGTEVGMLAAAISAVCRVAVPGTLLSLARPSEWGGAGLARLCLHLDSPAFRHEVFLDLPPRAVPPFLPDQLPAAMVRRCLQVPLRFELARTTIPAGEWAQARAGDAVIFGPHPGESSLDQIPAQLICGAFAALVRIGRNKTACIVRLFTPLAPLERKSMSDDTARNHAEAVIAGAPIEVVAECGRIVLPADELMSLRPGAVLPLGSPASNTIQLRVGGRLWADGELVNVEGQLGVRLTSLATD